MPERGQNSGAVDTVSDHTHRSQPSLQSPVIGAGWQSRRLRTTCMVTEIVRVAVIA
jgi:hypothetical protein